MAAFERISKLNYKIGSTVVDVARTRLPSIRPEETDYDPRDHRSPAQPIKPWLAYFNLLRTMCGAGMLGMPIAISQGGILLGPSLAISTGLLLIHTHTMLLNSLCEISRQLKIPHISYRYGFRLAVLHGPPMFHGIGRSGPALIATFMFLSQLGICTVFVSLTSDSLRDLMDWQSNRPALLTLLFPYLLLEFFMKSLNIVSYVALLGNALNLVGLILIIVQLCSNLTGDLVTVKTSSMGAMVALGICMFNLSAVGVILTIDKALKEPKMMTSKFGIINVGIFVPCVIATLFGVLGYCSFGTIEQNILRSLPIDEMSSMASIGLYLVAVAFAYPVQCYPAIAVILEVIKYHDPLSSPSAQSLLLIESVLRPIFVLMSFILCYLVPFQTCLVAFVGNMCTSMVSLVFPALMDLCLRAAFDKTSRLNIMTLGVGMSVLDVARIRLPAVRPEETDFDPRDYRTPLQPIKLWMAYFNLLRTMCGAGMLGMPLAISQAGIIAGPILTFMTGLLLIHTHRLLLDTLTEVSRQLNIPYISYRYGFRLAVLHGPPLFRSIGNHGPTIIATFMFLSQLGICSVFVMLTSDSLRDIMDWQSSRPALLTLLFPYLLLEFFMKSLNIISYVALLGNFLNMIGLAVIIYHLFENLTGDLIVPGTSAQALMFSFGTLLFNLSAVGIILSVDKALTEAKKMSTKFGVINVGIFVPTCIAVMFGTLGYCSFGTMEENILRVLPYDERSSMVAIGLYLIAVAFAYPVQCYPAIAVILEVIKYHDPITPPSEHTLLLIESLGRPIFVVISFIVCYLIPFQGPFVAFVGNMCTTMLSLVFPALMDICLRYPDHYGEYDLILLKDVMIICLGIAAAIYGVFQCVHLIYIRIMSANSPNTQGFY